MKVGLAVDDLSTIAAEARRAEEQGFDYLACGEHAFFYGPTPNAFIALAAAAGATDRIRLVSTVSLAAQYPAALFAKLASSLDVASAGRFEIGIGAGGEYEPEFDAVGVDPASRFRRIEEAVTVLRLLFTGETIDFEGEFTRLDGVRLQPPPVQRPSPPIWMAGRRSVGIRRVARLADVWLPYMVTPEKLAAGLDEIRAAETEHGRPPGTVDGAIYAWTCCGADGDRARQTGIDVVSRIYNQDFSPLADRYLFLGTPEEIVDRLGRFAAAGAKRVILSIAAGPGDRAGVRQTLVDHVLPALAAL